MPLDDDACYRVFCARDSRFDGRIFVGVHTTGIYCRPICPAPPPKRKNVSFFETAVAAQQAGYRPCLRCRPEVSPRFAAWNGSASTVTRALRLIEGGALDNADTEQFAARLGVSGRQLRRLFADHVGAPPIAFAQMRRIHTAKQLLQETRISVTEVALAAGYRSLRRFNEAFFQTFGRTPGQFRRAPDHNCGRISLRLGFAPPFDWAGTLDRCHRRAIPGVEAVSDAAYHRTVREGDSAGSITVRRLDQRSLAVDVSLPESTALPLLLERVRSFFDLGADPAELTSRFNNDTEFGQRLMSNPGIRVMGPWDAFEHVVRTVVDHYVDRSARPDRLAALANSYGRRMDHRPEQLSILFPDAGRIAAQSATNLMPETDAAAAIKAYAQAVVEDRSPLTLYDKLEDAIGKMKTLSGFDTALAKKCAVGFLHPTDALGDILNYDVGRYERWRPWRAYAALLDREHDRDACHVS